MKAVPQLKGFSPSRVISRSMIIHSTYHSPFQSGIATREEAASPYGIHFYSLWVSKHNNDGEVRYQSRVPANCNSKRNISAKGTSSRGPPSSGRCENIQLPLESEQPHIAELHASVTASQRQGRKVNSHKKLKASSFSETKRLIKSAFPVRHTLDQSNEKQDDGSTQRHVVDDIQWIDFRKPWGLPPRRMAPGSSKTQRRAEPKPLRRVICRNCGWVSSPKDDPSFRCCHGKTYLSRHKTPQTDLGRYIVDSSDQWKISERSLPIGHFTSITALCNAVEQDVLSLLRSVTWGSVHRVLLSDYHTRPWFLRASDLSDPGSLLRCFAAKSESFANTGKLSNASIGSLLHAQLDAACASGAMGERWSMATSKFGTIDEGSLHLRVHGTCDAVYDKIYPVELKTVDDMSQISGKSASWLRQIAVYQSLYGNTNAIIVVICRNSFEVRAFEVHTSNITNAIACWRRWITDHPLLQDCISLSRPYCQALEERCVRGAVHDEDPRLFQELLELSIPLFIRHTELLLLQHKTEVENGNVEVAVVCFVRVEKYLKMLKAAAREAECSDQYANKMDSLIHSLHESRSALTTLSETFWERGEKLVDAEDVDSLVEASKCFTYAGALFRMLVSPSCSKAASATKRKRYVKAKLIQAGIDTSSIMLAPDINSEENYSDDDKNNDN